MTTLTCKYFWPCWEWRFSVVLYVEVLVLQVSSWHVGIRLLIEEIEKIDKCLNPSSSCFPVTEVESDGVQPNQTVSVHRSPLERLVEPVPSPGRPPDDVTREGSDLPDVNVGQAATNELELMNVTGQFRVIEDNTCNDSQDATSWIPRTRFSSIYFHRSLVRQRQQCDRYVEYSFWKCFFVWYCLWQLLTFRNCARLTAYWTGYKFIVILFWTGNRLSFVPFQLLCFFVTYLVQSLWKSAVAFLCTFCSLISRSNYSLSLAVAFVLVQFASNSKSQLSSNCVAMCFDSSTNHQYLYMLFLCKIILRKLTKVFQIITTNVTAIVKYYRQ